MDKRFFAPWSSGQILVTVEDSARDVERFFAPDDLQGIAAFASGHFPGYVSPCIYRKQDGANLGTVCVAVPVRTGTEHREKALAKLAAYPFRPSAIITVPQRTITAVFFLDALVPFDDILVRLVQKMAVQLQITGADAYERPSHLLKTIPLAGTTTVVGEKDIEQHHEGFGTFRSTASIVATVTLDMPEAPVRHSFEVMVERIGLWPARQDLGIVTNAVLAR